MQEQEYNAYRVSVEWHESCLFLMRTCQQKEHNIPATLRDAPDVPAEELEAEREAEQKKIDEAVPLTEDELAEKEQLISQGFENWSRRDFQQFVRALENHGW